MSVPRECITAKSRPVSEAPPFPSLNIAPGKTVPSATRSSAAPVVNQTFLSCFKITSRYILTATIRTIHFIFIMQ